jgi:nucleoside-diphosphate-sugar epimerase
LTGSVVRPAAAALLDRRLSPASRVLVLGAGGWFGSTMLALLGSSAAEVIGWTGRPRHVTIGGRAWELGGWEWAAVARLEPTVVVNCAFLTRERVEQEGFERYVAENGVLTSRFCRTLTLPSVRAAVTVSSGAAVAADALDVEANPYGQLKWAEEVLSRNVAERHDVALVVCRAWSVSGPLVLRPRDYAFSDLVLQAAAGTIGIKAAHEVWRRYVGVDELLAVCVSLALDGWSGDVESGGPLVELSDLAQTIAAVLAPGVRIERPDPDGSAPDRYHSDGRSWDEACERVSYVPAPLEEQIRVTAEELSRL